MDYKSLTEDDLQKIVSESHSWNEVVQKCGLKTLTRSLQRNIKKFEINCDHLNEHHDGLYTKFNSRTKDELEEIIRTNDEWDTIVKAFGYNTCHVVPTLKKKLDKLNIAYDHVSNDYTVRYKEGKVLYSLEEILIEDSCYADMKSLLRRLKRERGWEHKCSVCSLTEWNNQPIPLEIDHINGVHSDNRIENIRAICPNCHAQTDNYKGKNMRICKNKQETSSLKA